VCSFPFRTYPRSFNDPERHQAPRFTQQTVGNAAAEDSSDSGYTGSAHDDSVVMSLSRFFENDVRNIVPMPRVLLEHGGSENPEIEEMLSARGTVLESFSCEHGGSLLHIVRNPRFEHHFDTGQVFFKQRFERRPIS
jgi:hypothetical protein